MSFRNKLHGLPPEKRLMAVVSKNGPRSGRLGRCWVKIGTLGEWYVSVEGKLVRANRLSWTLFVGPIPSGKEVCHHCDNPNCIRPSHLFLGTHKENMEDMSRKGRGRGGVVGSNNSSSKYPHIRQGDNNGNRILSSSDVKVIRKRYRAGGETYRSLAARFGVSDVTINRVVNLRSWKTT